MDDICPTGTADADRGRAAEGRRLDGGLHGRGHLPGLSAAALQPARLDRLLVRDRADGGDRLDRLLLPGGPRPDVPLRGRVPGPGVGARRLCRHESRGGLDDHRTHRPRLGRDARGDRWQSFSD